MSVLCLEGRKKETAKSVIGKEGAIILARKGRYLVFFFFFAKCLGFDMIYISSKDGMFLRSKYHVYLNNEIP